MKNLFINLAIILAVILVSLSAFAQTATISPLNSEHGKKARGTFTITNDSYTPLPVSLEATSVSFTKGDLVSPLLPSTHLKLSQYSARIPAKQTYTFAYDIHCDIYPCSTIIWVTFMTGGHTDSGIAIGAKMGTVIYSCEREKNCRRSVQARLNPNTNSN